MLRSAGIRYLIVAALALLMFVPLFFVGAIIDSRSEYSREAVTEVGREWGGAQLLSGPVMIVPVTGPQTRAQTREVTDPNTGAIRTEQIEVTEIMAKSAIYILPETFDLALDTQTTIRRRGIFAVPVYSGEAELDFSFDLSGASQTVSPDETIHWDDTFLRVSLTTNRALRGAAELLVDGTARPLEPVFGSNRDAGGITADLGDPRRSGTYKLILGLNGAESFQTAPVGRTSRVKIKSDWPHPSFFGAFLPDSSEITEKGFSATWTIPHLARALPQIARADSDLNARGQTAFGVRFFQPNDFYQKAYRAARYGILFIALTFLTVLLIENRTQKPTHPVQYILIGIAQSLFVLLMVAYAEQIGFGPAYALSAGATIGLLTMFGAVGLKLGSRTAVLAVMLVLLYAVLYLILRSADYALLAGATLAFAALAGTMYMTRNEDWYGPPREKKRKKGEEDAVALKPEAAPLT
ncbi:MAG: cell envelope integrity protein CreD [Dinoroseobacter sp.]|nr:cell envelope integrity protein CreD [Dinoroseobacter sp.]